MENSNKNLFMKIDGIKKISPHLRAKARTMGALRKILVMYRSGRIVKGLLVIAAVAWIAYDNFTAHATDENIRYTVIFGTLFLLVALYMIASGLRRMMRAIAVIECGTVTTAAFGSVSRSTRRTGTLSWGIYRHTWTASCAFSDAAGKHHKIEVVVPDEHFLRKGDHIDIVYDPGMPANALAIGALPSIVKTVPPLKA